MIQSQRLRFLIVPSTKQTRDNHTRFVVRLRLYATVGIIAVSRRSHLITIGLSLAFFGERAARLQSACTLNCLRLRTHYPCIQYVRYKYTYKLYIRMDIIAYLAPKDSLFLRLLSAYDIAHMYNKDSHFVYTLFDGVSLARKSSYRIFAHRSSWSESVSALLAIEAHRSLSSLQLPPLLCNQHPPQHQSASTPCYPEPLETDQNTRPFRRIIVVVPTLADSVHTF